MRAVFPNPDPPVLLPGLFCRIRTPLEDTSDVLLVPERAIGIDQGGRYVFVVDDENVVHHRSIEVGQKTGQQRVVASGLEDNEWVIVNGLLRARPGGKVTPERVEPKNKSTTKAPTESTGN